MGRCVLGFLVVLCMLLSSSVGLASSPDYLPELELLGGVLSQTSWMENNGPRGLGNEYFRAIQTFFSDYKEHEAVRLAQALTKRGFTYDAPPAFICHLGPLPDLELIHEYSDYLIKRAGGRKKLEEFRLALKDLGEQSEFLQFYAQWEPYLAEVLDNTVQGLRSDLITAWLEDFFGWSAEEFHLLMTPSMFPGGGYGATVETRDKKLIAYQIIRENGMSQGKPEFPTGVSLEHLTVHELGHAFVNPSLEAYPERAKKLRPLLVPVRRLMKNQAYPTVTIFLNEQILRGVEVVASRDLFDPEVEVNLINRHEERGFYLIRYVVEQLELYQSRRDVYPTFREFVPYLYDQLDLYQNENSTLGERLLGNFL